MYNNVKKFKYFKEDINSDISIDEMLYALLEIGKDNLDPYFVNELENYCAEYITIQLLENEEEYNEPKPGDLAKATAKEIAKASMFAFIVGKVVTKVIDPNVRRITKFVKKNSEKTGAAIRTGAFTAGKFVGNKTGLTKQLKELDKLIASGKKNVRGLVTKAKKQPKKTAMISIGIILGVVAVHKIYKVLKERKELELEREKLRLEKNKDLEKEIESLTKEIKKLRDQEVKIRIEYEEDLEKERKDVLDKVEKDPEYSEKLAKQATKDYNTLNKL
jgi:hypothetical protein